MTTTQKNTVTPAATITEINLAELKQRVKELERQEKEKEKEAKARATAKAKEVMSILKQGCPTGQTFMKIGNAAAKIEAAGFDWRDLGSINDVFATAETLETLASHPLVTTFGLPAAWLIGDNGAPMGVNGLATIETAIELANRLSVDVKGWSVKYTAVQVQTEVLPNLVAQLAELEAEARKSPEERALDALKVKIAKSEATFAAMPNQNSRDARTLRKQITAWEALVRRGPEAFKAKPAAMPTTTVISNGPGTIFVQDGVRVVQCRGINCDCVGPVTEAQVSLNLKTLKYLLKTTDVVDLLDEDKLAAVSFLKCHSGIIKDGTQSIPKALEAIRAEVDRLAKERQERQNQTAAERQAQGDKPQGGDVVMIGDIEHVVCSCRGCENKSTLDEARGPLDLRYVARECGLRDVEQVTEEHLRKLNACPTCDPKRYPGGSQDLTTAIEKIEAIKQEAQNEERRREKALLARTGGAAGDVASPDSKGIANKRQRRSIARDKTAKALALMPGCNTTVGNGKKSKGGGKKGKKDKKN